MTPPVRPPRDLDEALARALEDLEAGLDLPEILDRYQPYSVELAPLLQTAVRLRGEPWAMLSMSGRVRGRERMHAALHERQAPRRAFPLVWRQLGAALGLLLLAAVTLLAWPGNGPLQPLRRPAATATGAPAIGPSASPSDAPATRTPAGTPRPSATHATSQPALDLDDEDLRVERPALAATVTVTPTRPRATVTPTRTRPVIPTATNTITPTATLPPTQPPQDPPPPRTETPAATESPTAVIEPSPTHTPPLPSPKTGTPPRPPATIIPVPTETGTPEPPATETVTPQPPATGRPSETPETPETPEPTGTPDDDDDRAPAAPAGLWEFLGQFLRTAGR